MMCIQPGIQCCAAGAGLLTKFKPRVGSGFQKPGADQKRTGSACITEPISTRLLNTYHKLITFHWIYNLDPVLLLNAVFCTGCVSFSLFKGLL